MKFWNGVHWGCLGTAAFWAVPVGLLLAVWVLS